MAMRNAEPFVKTALCSVLLEREVSLEVVVVDDASSDGSSKVVRALADPRVRLLSGRQRGHAATLNTALAAARGEFVMLCDSDDFFPRDRIASQIAWLEAHPSHGAVCGSYTTVDAQGLLIAHMLKTSARDIDIEEELKAGATRTSLCTFAIRREAIERVGGFRTYFETSADIDFQLRLGETSRVHWRTANTYFYRLHDSSVTHSQANVRREFFESTARIFVSQRRIQGSDDLQRGEPPTPPQATHGKGTGSAIQIQGMLIGQAWRTWKAGKRRDGLRTVLRSIRLRPSTRSPWWALLVMACKGVVPQHAAVDEVATQPGASSQS